MWRGGTAGYMGVAACRSQHGGRHAALVQIMMELDQVEAWMCEKWVGPGQIYSWVGYRSSYVGSRFRYKLAICFGGATGGPGGGEVWLGAGQALEKQAWSLGHIPALRGEVGVWREGGRKPGEGSQKPKEP